MAVLGRSGKQRLLPQRSNGNRLEKEKETQWGRVKTVVVFHSSENYTHRKKRTKESQHIYN